LLIAGAIEESGVYPAHYVATTTEIERAIFIAGKLQMVCAETGIDQSE
jgi:hypothetical protein